MLGIMIKMYFKYKLIIIIAYILKNKIYKWVFDYIFQNIFQNIF
jgi:hypothetical protein